MILKMFILLGVSWICSLVSGVNDLVQFWFLWWFLLPEAVTPTQLSTSPATAVDPLSLSSLLSKKTVGFSVYLAFYLLGQWQHPTSTCGEPLTANLSKVANLMVCRSAGLLSPILFYPMQPAEMSPSLICRPLVLFSNACIYFSIRISPLVSVKACLAQCALRNADCLHSH